MKPKKVDKAIEADAGHKMPGLEQSLVEMRGLKAGRSYTPEQLLIREARKVLRMTQLKFAELINTPVGTLRDWEQGRFRPPGAVIRLSKIAISHPKIVMAS